MEDSPKVKLPTMAQARKMAAIQASMADKLTDMENNNFVFDNS